MYELIASRRFSRDLSRILKKSPQLESRLLKTLNLLMTNPSYPTLRLHKLSGLGANYSISVDMSIRIIINFDKDKIFLTRIGKHEDVY